MFPTRRTGCGVVFGRERELRGVGVRLGAAVCSGSDANDDGRGEDGHGGRSAEPDPCGGAGTVAAVCGCKQLGGW